MAATRTDRSIRPTGSVPAWLRRTMLVVGVGLAAMHAPVWATSDWTTAAPTCTPDSKRTLSLGITSALGGFLQAGAAVGARAEGRNPPLAYYCPVWNPDDLTTASTWSHLQLQFRDPTSTGGQVRARLYSKNRSTGIVKLVASASSVPSSTIHTVSVPLRNTVDFAINAYYVVLELENGTQAVEAHMVMLTN